MDVPEMGIDPERLIGGVFCGIDPGREKFGFALAVPGKLVFAAIIPSDRLDAALAYISSGDAGQIMEWRTEGAAHTETIKEVFIGNGTSHAEYEKKLREAGVSYKLTDERMTTLEARGLYWKLHPPKGLLKIIPKQLRVPARNLDDLAAWAIIERGLSAR